MTGRNYLKSYVNALRRYEADKRLLHNLETHTCWPYGRRLKGLPPDAIRSRELLRHRIKRADLILRRAGEKIARALAKMEDRTERQYIEMRYLQGLPMEEIAYVIGYSERQLYRLTRKMEQKFLRKLSEEPGVTRYGGTRHHHTYHITVRQKSKEKTQAN